MKKNGVLYQRFYEEVKNRKKKNEIRNTENELRVMMIEVRKNTKQSCFLILYFYTVILHFDFLILHYKNHLI
jgi:hypothetical protein